MYSGKVYSRLAPGMTTHTQAGIPLLTHDLTVKLCPCHNHSSPARRIADVSMCGQLYVYGHPKHNLLPSQACPKMIQYISSIHGPIP